MISYLCKLKVWYGSPWAKIKLSAACIPFWRPQGGIHSHVHRFDVFFCLFLNFLFSVVGDFNSDEEQDETSVELALTEARKPSCFCVPLIVPCPFQPLHFITN